MQAGLGWQVCRALIPPPPPRTKGLILTRQAVCEALGLTHMCCCGRLFCFVLHSEFSYCRISYPKKCAVKASPFWTTHFEGHFLYVTSLHDAATQAGWRGRWGATSPTTSASTRRRAGGKDPGEETALLDGGKGCVIGLYS